MHAHNASFVERLFEKVGAALELASTAEEEDERAYWLGVSDCAIELIAEETDATCVEVKAEVTAHYDELSLADRVNGAFNERSN